MNECDEYQLFKITNRKYNGKICLQSSLHDKASWQQLDIDLYKEWCANFSHEATKLMQEQKNLLLTICNTSTNWCEFPDLNYKMTLCVAHKLDPISFCKYPWPEAITYDNGKEFLSVELQELLDSYGIVDN